MRTHTSRQFANISSVCERFVRRRSWTDPSRFRHCELPKTEIRAHRTGRPHSADCLGQTSDLMLS
eukprot:6177747-Pleurochrysis_carterae.AAC.3